MCTYIYILTYRILLSLYAIHKYIGMRTFLRDSRTFLFLNAKIKSLFGQRKKPAKIAWTVAYRKEHKKDQSTVVKQKKRKINKNASKRSYVSASLEVLQKKRQEKPDVRAAARAQALREIKERNAKKKAGGLSLGAKKK